MGTKSREAIDGSSVQASRTALSDVFGNVYAQCVELMTGRAAERMLLEASLRPLPTTFDRHASLLC